MGGVIVSPKAGRTNIAHRVERLPASSYQFFTAGLILLAWFFESIDLGGIGYLMPVLAKEFNIDPATLGMMGSMSFVGMLVGAMASGILADRFGRKRLLVAAMIFWGVCGVLLANAWSVESLFVFRFLLGLGLGAQAPVAITLLSEFVPSKARAKYITAYMAFMPLGYVAAGLISYFFLPLVNWRGVFLIEALPCLWALMIWKFMPESVFWLESKGRYSEADSVMSQIEKNVEKNTGVPLPPVEAPLVKGLGQAPAEAAELSPIRELFSRQYIITLVMIAIWWPAALAGLYGLSTWLSALMVAKGFTITKSIAYVSVITLGGVLPVFLMRYLVDKIGRKWSVVLMALATAVTAYIYGNANTMTGIIITGLIYNFCLYGAGMVNQVYTPELFPTRLRGTGVGFANSVGRIGGIVGPMAAGFIMASYGFTAVFLFGAAVYLLYAIVVALLGYETKGKVF
ncbi:MAG: MFS transporter [Bacillota bacterium]